MSWRSASMLTGGVTSPVTPVAWETTMAPTTPAATRLTTTTVRARRRPLRMIPS